MIYVSFFPLQIPIYFEFLDLTRYQFYEKVVFFDCKNSSSLFSFAINNIFRIDSKHEASAM